MMHPQKSAQSILPDLDFLDAFPTSSCIRPLPLLPALPLLADLADFPTLTDLAEAVVEDPELVDDDDEGSSPPPLEDLIGRRPFPSLLFELPSTSSTE